MARETSGRIKKYGVCLNSSCAQYKQIQEIVHGDMECPECKKKLSPCAPPKKKSNKKVPLIAGGAILATAIVIGCILALSGGDTEPKEPVAIPADSTEAVKPDTVTVVKTDTVKQVDTVTVAKVVEKQVPVAAKAKTSAPKATAAPKASAASGNGTLRLSYGKYNGAIKNGYPHGQGRLTYTRSRQINRSDAKGRTANAGDYVIGEFYNGFLVYGKHYDSAGNLLGSLNFGVGNESSYDSK